MIEPEGLWGLKQFVRWMSRQPLWNGGWWVVLPAACLLVAACLLMACVQLMRRTLAALWRSLCDAIDV